METHELGAILPRGNEHVPAWGPTARSPACGWLRSRVAVEWSLCRQLKATQSGSPGTVSARAFHASWRRATTLAEQACG